CEQGAPLITESVQVTPSIVEPGKPIHVKVFAEDDRAVTAVWANGLSLHSADGRVWEGDLLTGSESGPQTVFALAEDADHKIATQIGVYETRRESDFSIQALDTQRTIAPGGVAEFRISVIGPPSTGVSLSVEGLPPRSGATFSQGVVIPAPGPGTESRLTIATSETTAEGTYTLTLRATNGTFTHEAQVFLVVSRPTWDFELQSSRSSVEPFCDYYPHFGCDATLEITAVHLFGRAQPVFLSVQGLPAQFQFSPNPVTSGGTTTLYFYFDELPSGVYRVTVVGTSGTLIRTVSFDLIVL
ncbi:MAG TPA: hypothetical protein VFV34_25535, partial [Blastocatellia bacterium]|nr:hypothetical protein [Blastocatellia bacterium]